jgi:hypothetical protein
MVRTCSSLGEGRNGYKILVRKIEGALKKQLQIGCIFLYNTKTYFRRTGHETAY